MKPFGSRQAGTSLVELIMSLAMMAIIGGLAAEYFRRSESGDYEQRARARAVAKMDLTLNVISRDLDRREMPPAGEMPKACNDPICDSFRYVRLAKSLSGAENSRYGLQWTTYCQGLDPNKAALAKSKGHPIDFSPTGINKIVSPTSPQYPRCMVKKSCGSGQFPQIIRHVMDDQKAGWDNSQHPSYPPSVFPKTDKNLALDDILAAALCVDGSNPKNDRLIIETAILTSEMRIRFERKEMLVPRTSISKLQVLSE